MKFSRVKYWHGCLRCLISIVALFTIPSGFLDTAEAAKPSYFKLKYGTIYVVHDKARKKVSILTGHLLPLAYHRTMVLSVAGEISADKYQNLVKGSTRMALLTQVNLTKTVPTKTVEIDLSNPEVTIGKLTLEWEPSFIESGVIFITDDDPDLYLAKVGINGLPTLIDRQCWRPLQLAE